MEEFSPSPVRNHTHGNGPNERPAPDEPNALSSKDTPQNYNNIEGKIRALNMPLILLRQQQQANIGNEQSWK